MIVRMVTYATNNMHPIDNYNDTKTRQDRMGVDTFFDYMPLVVVLVWIALIALTFYFHG